MKTSYILQEEVSGKKKKFENIIDIVRFFKTEQNYKIPNYLKESLNQGYMIRFTSNNIPYSITKKEK